MFYLTKYEHSEPRIIITFVLLLFVLSSEYWVHNVKPDYLSMFLKVVLFLSCAVIFCLACNLPNWLKIDQYTIKIRKNEGVPRSLLARARLWIDMNQIEKAEIDLCNLMVLSAPPDDSVYTNIGKLLMQQKHTSFASTEIWRYANWNNSMSDDEIIQAFQTSAAFLVEREKSLSMLRSNSQTKDASEN